MNTLIAYITRHDDLNSGQMKKNDIRIGNNLLLYGEVVKVTEIGFKNDDYYLRIEGNKNGYYIDQFEPIKLTEEILLKCEGIIKHPTIENRYLLEDSNYSFHIEDGDWDNPSLDILINGMYIICVEFLHEFQNLYWALCRKELEIEL